jgi:hypothetical protein
MKLLAACFVYMTIRQLTIESAFVHGGRLTGTGIRRFVNTYLFSSIGIRGTSVIFDPTFLFGTEHRNGRGIPGQAGGALSVFLVGTDQALYRADQNLTVGTWSWAKMGGTWPRQPVVGTNVTGGLSVFLIGTDTALYRYDQNGPGGPWSTAQSMGGTWSKDPVVYGSSVYLIGNDTVLYRWDQAQNASWSWASMGGTWPGQPVVGSDAAGNIDVFVDRERYRALSVRQAGIGLMVGRARHGGQLAESACSFAETAAEG